MNERDERGRTPLMLLITQRMPVQALDLLIERGAELEAEDKDPSGEDTRFRALAVRLKERLKRTREE